MSMKHGFVYIIDPSNDIRMKGI